MLKSELRKIYKAKRAALTADEMQLYSAQICKNAFDAFGQKDLIISLFFSIQKQLEIDTSTMFNSFKNVFCTITGSVSDFSKNTLIHKEVSNLSDLKVNQYGIPEPKNGQIISPQQFDVVFVPLLVCNQKGFRVGYGKGFYDRFLAQCSSKCKFVGLNFFDPVATISDIDKFDIPLTHLVTPEHVIEF